jgi:alkylmercury lyase-like protein
VNKNEASLMRLRTTARSPLHRFILETFAAAGRSPTLEDIRKRFALGTIEEAESCVAELEATGAIHRTAGDALITHAYPFSNEPTGHSVQLDSGPRVFAMCAIDALGMPFMLKRGAQIESSCIECASPVRVQIERATVTKRSPRELMVWLFDQPEGCVVATDICPSLNFFCSVEHLKRWQRQTDSTGRQLTLAEAVTYGRRVFEGLMNDDRQW